MCYTPRATETDAFLADLRTLNPTLLRDSIYECHRASKSAGMPEGTSKRDLIHAVYTRKVKELASLYPFIFTTENALRSVAHEAYSNTFRDPYWWRDILDCVARQKGADHYTTRGDGKKRLRKTPVNPAFIRECIDAAESFAPRQTNRLSNPDCPPTRFYEELTIWQLFNVIISDLSLCPVGKLKRIDLENSKRTICDTRNEVFHGRPVKNRSSLLKACDLILNSLGFHMGDFDERLRTTSFARQTPSRMRTTQHLIPPLQ